MFSFLSLSFCHNNTAKTLQTFTFTRLAVGRGSSADLSGDHPWIDSWLSVGDLNQGSANFLFLEVR